MISSNQFADKKILVIDKAPKTENDRTWCFWEQGEGFFEHLVYKKWSNLSFFSQEYASSFSILPYQYKMIRGVDFYNYCFSEIAKHKNIELLYAEVGKVEYTKEGLVIYLDGKPYALSGTGTTVFNSIYNPAAGDRIIKLLQHFKGWFIETPQAFFDPGNATLMDFRIPQDHGTSFVYVLPFSPTTALVEYTLFTKSILPGEAYDAALADYISGFLKLDRYTIKEKEFGVIPMTNEKFSFAGNGWNIGTAGGQTKASSGYTFQFIQKQSRQIVAYLCAGKSLNSLPSTPRRFRFYDNTLLDILYHDRLPGDTIFSKLFQKNKPQQVLRFLDNETSLVDELKIISSLPKLPFLKAALRQL